MGKEYLREPFVVYRRKKSKYYQFYYYQGDKRIRVSTGKRSRSLAIKYAEDYVQNLLPPTTLNDFTKDSFIWGKCEVINDKHEHGKRFSKGNALCRRGHLDNHILPVFGTRHIATITSEEIDS